MCAHERIVKGHSNLETFTDTINVTKLCMMVLYSHLTPLPVILIIFKVTTELNSFSRIFDPIKLKLYTIDNYVV